jgi:hypothetical protein
MVAIFKVSQSVGAAIAYQLTTDDLSARRQFISNWALIACTLLVACKFFVSRESSSDRDQSPFSTRRLEDYRTD